MPQSLTQSGTLTSASATIAAGTSLSGNLAFTSYALYGAILAPAGLGRAAITNAGLIDAIGASANQVEAGILLAAGGIISNSGTIEVTGAEKSGYAIDSLSPATFTNSGKIQGPAGIYLPGGSLTNSTTGTILATATWHGSFNNAGIGNNNPTAATTIANAGQIAAAYFGIGLAGPATIQNSGTIRGNFAVGYGIELAGGGSVNNSGLITGGYAGLNLTGAAVTLFNSGTITATTAARQFHPHIGTAAELYSSLSNNLTNSATGLIAGAQTGIRTGNAGATIINAGTISGATTAIAFAASFANRLIIEPTAVFAGTVNGGNPLGSSIASTLELAGSGTLSGLNTEFINFATIIIDPGATWTVANNTTIDAGQTVIMEGTLIAPSLVDNGLIIQTAMACFAAGTRILTPRGEIAVEHLHPGDPIITTTGAEAAIQWIGRRTVNLAQHPAPEKAQPIRIAAGAIADGIPARDLSLSPDHALYFENHLIPAKALLNHRNVVQLALARITYYHIELAGHAALFAEHTPCETYLETGNRACFENASTTTLHPNFAPAHFQSLREAGSFATLTESGPTVEHLRTILLLRAFNNPTRPVPLPVIASPAAGGAKQSIFAGKAR